MSYIGKRIERRGLSVKEGERREKRKEVGDSKDSGAKRKKKDQREEMEESLRERV